ncbi:MAG: hypothetical protein NZP34_11765, partial [Caldilineales bacterium]|nr:hypothetical protein [Caldilineales bacterium]
MHEVLGNPFELLWKWVLKRRRRWLRIASGSFYNLSLPLINVLVSWLVVRLGSLALWGSFVQVMLWVQLGAMVAGWG